MYSQIQAITFDHMIVFCCRNRDSSGNLFSGASIQNGGTMLTSIVNSRVKLMKFTVLVFTLMPTALVVTIMSLGNFKYNVNL